MSTDFRRPGFTAVTPGLCVNSSGQLFTFLERAFGATLVDGQRDELGNFGHAELRIGDSLMELSEAKPKWPAKPCAHHLYVPDTDAVYTKAIAAGAQSLQAPRDAEYGERTASVKDAAGNHWYIATRLEGGPIPPGFRTVTPYVITKGADAIIGMMKAAFGAKEHMRVPRADGSIMHAALDIGGSMIEMADGADPWRPMPCGLHVYVPDVDGAYERALRAGATSVYTPIDQFYGDRECAVLDSGGNYWFIATYKEDVSPEEMQRRMAAMK